MSGGIALAAVLIPARNEAASIEGCLRRVLAQDLGSDVLEVIVVDGDSSDGTGDIARRILSESGLRRWVVHRNLSGTTPSNLNAGLALVTAPVLCRVDARSLIPSDYVRRCVAALDRDGTVAVVGGAQVSRPRSDRSVDRGIARALNNRWGMGMSRYRRADVDGPSDTVYLGAFRTAELRLEGGWNERFVTNQDFELNRRMSRHGSIWFLSDLEVDYLPRTSIGEVFRQYKRFGSAKAMYWRTKGDPPRPRQMAALAFAPAVGLAVFVGFFLGRRSRVALALLGIAAAAALEDRGAREATGSPAERAWSFATLGAVWSGWSIGAWSGLLGGTHSSVTVTRPSVRSGSSE